MRKATSQKILTNPLEDLSGHASINLQPSPSSRRSSTRKLGESKTFSTYTLHNLNGRNKPISIYKTNAFLDPEPSPADTIVHKWDINTRWNKICDNTVFKPTDLEIFRKKEQKKNNHVKFQDETITKEMPESEHMYYYFEMNRNSQAMEKILRTNIKLPLSGTGERSRARPGFEDEEKNMRTTSFDAFQRRKITLKKQLAKMPMNQKQKRRRSCHCCWCGGMSQLEKKLELDKTLNKDVLSQSRACTSGHPGTSNPNSPILQKKKRLIKKGTKMNQQKRPIVFLSPKEIKENSQASSSVRFPSNSETDHVSSSRRNNENITPEGSLKRGITVKKPIDKLLSSHIRAASDERGKFSSMYIAMNSPQSVNISNQQLDEEGTGRSGGLERSKTLGKLHSEEAISPTAISPITNNSNSPHPDYNSSMFGKQVEEESSNGNNAGHGVLKLKLISRGKTMPNNDFIVEKQSSIVEFCGNGNNKSELAVVKELTSIKKDQGKMQTTMMKQVSRRNTRSQKSLAERPVVNQTPLVSISTSLENLNFDEKKSNLKPKSELKRIVRDKTMSTSSKIMNVYRPNTSMKLSSIIEMSKSKIEQHSVITPSTNFAKSATMKESPYYFAQSNKMPSLMRSSTSTINLASFVGANNRDLSGMGSNDQNSKLLLQNKLSTVRSEYIDESKDIMQAVDRMKKSLLKPAGKHKETMSQNSSLFASSGGSGVTISSSQKVGVVSGQPNKFLLDAIAKKLRNNNKGV